VVVAAQPGASPALPAPWKKVFAGILSAHETVDTAAAKKPAKYQSLTTRPLSPRKLFQMIRAVL
jgi:hypothetical protein